MSTADLEQEISRIDGEIAELQASLSELTAVESGITRPGSQQRDSGYSGHHEHQTRTPDVMESTPIASMSRNTSVNMPSQRRRVNFDSPSHAHSVDMPGNVLTESRHNYGEYITTRTQRTRNILPECTESQDRRGTETSPASENYSRGRDSEGVQPVDRRSQNNANMPQRSADSKHGNELSSFTGKPCYIKPAIFDGTGSWID
jgi:hypothetical protein